MELTTCPHCKTTVAITSDGNCPSCRRSVSGFVSDERESAEVSGTKAERPTSITVIAWIFIVMSVLNLVLNTVMLLGNPMVLELMAKSALPIPVQIVLLYVALIITLTCGVAMLKGQNWGRWLYVIWTIFAMIIGLLTSPMKAMLIPALLFFFVMLFFLFRPNATAFFTRSGVAGDESA